MKRTKFAAASLAVLLSIASFGCTPSSSATASEQLVLKAYDVPAEHAAELQGVVSNLLYTAKDQPPKGRAALSPGGQLMVSAPASFQPGIAEVVSRLKSAPAPRAPTIHLDYWVVVGIPSATATKGASIAPDIGDVVDSLEKSQGPMKLSLLERVQLSSQSGADAEAEGSIVRVRHTCALHGDKVVAYLDIHGSRARGLQNELNTRVELPLGQTVVLGQVGAYLSGAANVIADPDVAKAADVGTATTFYIVRASVDAK